MSTQVLCHKLRVARNLQVTAIYFVYILMYSTRRIWTRCGFHSANCLRGRVEMLLLWSSWQYQEISKWSLWDKREIKTRTCSGSSFLQVRSFINISKRILSKQLLPALTTFCIPTDLSAHPRETGRFKFRGKKGVDCFTDYSKGSRDFSPDYSQTRWLRQLWSNRKWSWR